MKNKKLILIIAAFLLLVAAALTVFILTRPQGSTDEKTFTLTVVHSNGSAEEFTITSSREFLSHALIDEGILTEEGLDDGMYLTVDGEIADYDQDGAYWSFYVGAGYATQGMNTTPIEDGAAYKLEYTTGFYGQ